MPGARVSGIGGLDAVDLTLSTGEASARVYLHGATVTSFCVEGKELLFVSEQAVFDGKRPIRGGVPLVFPQFGPGERTAAVPHWRHASQRTCARDVRARQARFRSMVLCGRRSGSACPFARRTRLCR